EPLGGCERKHPPDHRKIHPVIAIKRVQWLRHSRAIVAHAIVSLYRCTLYRHAVYWAREVRDQYRFVAPPHSASFPYSCGSSRRRSPWLRHHAGRRRKNIRRNAIERRHAVWIRKTHARPGADLRTALERPSGRRLRRRAPPVLPAHSLRPQ